MAIGGCGTYMPPNSLRDEGASFDKLRMRKIEAGID